MPPRAAGNALAGHIWPAGRLLHTLHYADNNREVSVPVDQWHLNPSFGGVPDSKI